MKTNILFTFLFALISINCFAQNLELRAKVIDETAQPVVGAVVALTTSDNNNDHTTLCDADGVFTFDIPSGEYTLSVKFLGLEDISQNIILDKSIDIGTITMQTKYTEIDGVTVLGVRPTIKREADRVTFNLNNSSYAHGANGLELLQYVPGVKASHNSIGIIGKGSVKIFINNRETKLTSDDLINLLKSYNASEIEKIEVITTPPARYDADGNTGIINIILKTIPQNFFGGTVSYTGYYQNFEEVKAYDNYSSLNLKYNKSAFSSFVNVNYSNGESGYIESNNINYPEQLWKNRMITIANNKPVNIRGGFDFMLDDKSSIGAHISYNKTDLLNTENNSSIIYSTGYVIADSTIYGTNLTHGAGDRINANLHFDRTFDSLGKKMLFDADYLSFVTNRDNSFRSEVIRQNDSYAGYGYDEHLSRNIRVVSSLLDFILPMRTLSITTGVKFSHTENDYRLNHINDTKIPNYDDRFIYRENILALYVDLDKKISDKFSLKVGLRGENTTTNGNSVVLGDSFDKGYFRLFPTLYATYNPSKNHILNLTFSNRISRPSFNMVNPFKQYANEYSYVQGKIELEPYFSYNTEIGYTYKNNLNFSLYYSISDNVFSQLLELNEQTKIIGVLWDNFLTQRRFGITNSYSLNKVDWLRIYFQHGLYYSANTSSVASNPGVSGWVYDAVVMSDFYLNKKKTLVASLSTNYSSRSYMGNLTMDSYVMMNGGVRYNVLNNRINFGFNVSNLFNLYAATGFINSNGMTMNIRNHYSIPTYRLSVSYNFGTKISSKTRTYSNSDITNRL